MYSIWICTESAQKRANSIERYELKKDLIVGRNNDNPRYDIINTTIINISKNHDYDDTECEIIKLLTSLFDDTLDAGTKISEMENKYGLPLTKEVKEEVTKMCTYATSIENKGISKGMEKGLRALVNSLKAYIKDFDALYEAIIQNEEYANVSKEQVKKYY